MNLDQSYLRNMSAMVVVFNFQSVQSPVEISRVEEFQAKNKDYLISRRFKRFGRSRRFGMYTRSSRSWNSKRFGRFRSSPEVHKFHEVMVVCKILEVKKVQ